MEYRFLKNDLKKNFKNNIIITLFISLSVAVIIAVFLTCFSLFSSIFSLYEVARPPHFLQLHKGDININEIEEFNKNIDYVEDSQVITLINAYGSDFNVIKMDKSKANTSLENFKLDISIVKQSEKFDYLLDKDKSILELKDGEIAVPRILLEDYDIEIGDTLRYKTDDGYREYKVSNIMYDAQMNTSMAGSVRFLLSDSDYDDLLKNSKDTEYMIESIFKDPDYANKYQVSYEESGLPKNGQAVTYNLIVTISAITDILNSLMFLIAGIIFMIISLVSLRYVIMMEIEEDRLVIGNMKALGISYRDIRNLYLNKFRLLSFVGVVFGYIISNIFTKFMTGRIERIFGLIDVGILGYMISIVVALIMYLIITIFVKAILKKIRKLSVIDIMVKNKGFSKSSDKKIKRLPNMPIDIAIPIHNSKSGYGIIILLVFASSIAMIFPTSMSKVFDGDEFLSYMGIEKNEAFVEIYEPSGRKDNIHQISKTLDEYSDYISYKTSDIYRQKITNDKYDSISAQIEVGNNIAHNIDYIEGRHVDNGKKEIAISYMIADELGLGIGDDISINVADKDIRLKIVGIYQDITSGGKTAKTAYKFNGYDFQKSVFYIDGDYEKISEDLKSSLKNLDVLDDNYKIYKSDEMVKQVFGPVARELKNISLIVSIIALSIVFIVVVLFEKLRLIKYSDYFLSKKHMGIKTKEIIKEEILASVFSGLKGFVIAILVLLLTISSVISIIFTILNLGISKINVVVTLADFRYVLILFIILIISTYLGARNIKNLNIRGENI